MTPSGSTSNAARWLFGATLLLTVACDGNDSSGPGSHGSGELRVIAGGPATDTVLAAPPQALVVEVRNASGELARRVMVRFESLAPAEPSRRYERGMFLCPVAAPTCGPVDPSWPASGSFDASDSTDSRGRAKVGLRYGTVAGPVLVELTVPEFGLTDTLVYSVTAGGVAGIVAATPDTTLIIGKSYRLHPVTADRFGNPRAAPVTYEAGPLVNVDALGVVTVTAPGRGNVVVHAEGYRDTAWVTVVPNGTVTASRFSTADSSGVVVFDLDGSNFRLLARATSGVGGMAPSWAPDGGSVIYHHGVYQSNALHVVDLSGASRPLIGSHPTLIDAVWARYTRDGSWIYFSGRPENENFSLWRVRPDGTGAEQFHPTTNNPGIEWRPSISPDASKLAYITVGSFRGAAVKTISTATRAPDPWEVPGQTPVWSPDGTRIALTGSIGDGGIRVMRADGTGVRRVSERDHGYGEGLDWSSDGEWLIVRGAAGLELINVETGLTLPLPFSGELYEPNWKR